MNAAPDVTLSALKMVISLGIVLAVIWGLYRVAKRNLPMAHGGGGGKGKMIQVLESQYLGVKKNVTMVQVPGAILVLGVAADNINLLAQINDPAVIKNIATTTDNRRSVLSFKDQFQRLTRSKGTGSPAGRNETVVE